MNEQQTRIRKRITQIKLEKKTYVCFDFRYLLEGKEIALSRNGDNTVYYGERITDYGRYPSPYLDIRGSVSAKTLEELFKGSVDGEIR